MTATLKISLRQLKAKKPCEGSYQDWKAKWPKGETLDAAQAVKLGCNLDDLTWIASAVALKDKDVERRLRYWMADCAARVLALYEKNYPADDRPRNAIVAARNYADGKITKEDFAASRAASRAASWAASRDASRAASRAAEEKWQLQRLVRWLSEKEPKPLALPRAQKAEAA